MTCRLCAWLCDRFCPPDASDNFWRGINKWETSNFDWEPAEGDGALRERWDLADSLLESDPAAALAVHRELADGGSPYSMLMAAWQCRAGIGTERDYAAAEEYCRRALEAGSWNATISYASLLFRRGAHDKWPATLDDGVRAGFIPAYFWRAWYGYKHAPTRETARDMGKLLAAAARAGHPAAKMLLSRWMATGKLGLREVPGGILMMIALVWACISDDKGCPKSAAGLARTPELRDADAHPERQGALT